MIPTTESRRRPARTPVGPGLLLALLAAGLLAAPHPAGAQESRLAATDHFRVHSDPWINLHHFLYQWARAEEDVGSGRADVPVPERDELEGLPAERSVPWRRAVDFYRRHLSERGHFDGVMLRIKNAMVEMEPGDARPDDPEGLARHLEAAMPVYRATWWPEHDRANRRWWDGARELVVEHQDFFASTYERAFGGAWDEPLRVDLSAYANWQGGYTSLRPDHTVVSSTDPSNRGLQGVEILFHEAGHQNSLFQPLRAGIREAFEAAGVDPPRNLWHAILFETAGWAMERVVEEEGRGPYTAYAAEGPLRTLRSWRELWPALEARWVPFLEGEATRQEALDGLARWFADGGGGGGLSRLRADAPLTARVVENVTLCRVDAGCSLRLALADTAVVAVYGSGEGPRPACETPRPASDAAFPVQAGDTVRVVLERCADGTWVVRSLSR